MYVAPSSEPLPNYAPRGQNMALSWISNDLLRQGCHIQGKSSGKWKNFQVREKSGNYIFSQGNFKKNEKNHGKVMEFQNFPKDAS